MANKKALIKAIITGDTEQLKVLVNLQPELVFLSAIEDSNLLADANGKKYSVEEALQLANKPGHLVFLPVESLTDEQLAEYLQQQNS